MAPSPDEISAHLKTLRSSSLDAVEIRSALCALERLATSGIEVETAHAILEAAVCSPHKEAFSDSVCDSLPVDECGASQHILRACATLDLQLTALQSLQYLPLPIPPKPTSIRTPIIQEVSSDAAEANVDVVSIVLQCLQYTCSPVDHANTAAPPWTGSNTATRADAILVAISHLTSSSSSRLVQPEDDLSGVEVMLRRTCVPCMKRMAHSFAGAPQRISHAEDDWHEGPGAFQRCIAAYQVLQYATHLHHPAASDCVTPLLPIITTALADPIPFAKRCAAAALSHIAEEATAASLYAHAGVLKGCIAQAFIGCEGLSWEAMLKAGCWMADRLDSVNGGSTFKMDVLVSTMTEVQRSDAADVWVPWLACLAGENGTGPHSLLCGMGPDVLMVTSKLLPMLLERLILANQAEIQTICKALQVLQASAPRRMRAHCDVIRAGLRCAEQQIHGLGDATDATEAVKSILDTAALFQAEP